MDSLTDTNQEDLSSAEAHEKYRDSHLENLRQWVESDSDEAFAARPSIKSVDEWGYTAIHWVLSEDESRIELLANLLNRKAATDIPDKYAHYAVHKAAEVGSVKQLQLLKRADATIWQRVGPDALLEHYDQHGWLGATALHLAVEGGHLEVLRLLLALEVDPCVQMWDGATALHIAANHLDPQGPDDYKGLVKGRERCLTLLLAESPKSKQIRDNLDRTPSHRALAKMAPYEIRRSFFKICAPLGEKKTGNSCYVAKVTLEYYHGENEWRNDKLAKQYDIESRCALIQELRVEGIKVIAHGCILLVKVNHQLGRP